MPRRQTPHSNKSRLYFDRKNIRNHENNHNKIRQKDQKKLEEFKNAIGVDSHDPNMAEVGVATIREGLKQKSTVKVVFGVIVTAIAVDDVKEATTVSDRRYKNRLK